MAPRKTSKEKYSSQKRWRRTITAAKSTLAKDAERQTPRTYFYTPNSRDHPIHKQRTPHRPGIPPHLRILHRPSLRTCIH
ncbi:MAG: hypothetical protein Q9204_008827 [Flavoplaca sp. TL-2023a]